MAAADAGESLRGAAEGAVLFDCLAKIRAACRLKSALPAKQRAEQSFVGDDGGDQAGGRYAITGTARHPPDLPRVLHRQPAPPDAMKPGRFVIRATRETIASAIC